MELKLRTHAGALIGPIVVVVIGIGLASLVVRVLTEVANRQIENDAKIEKEEAKVRAEKCKLVSNSVRAEPYVTEEPLSLFCARRRVFKLTS